MASMKSNALPLIGFVFFTILQFSYGQGPTMAPSPTPPNPSSDGNTIDQGVAYILMVVALAVTYLLH